MRKRDLKEIAEEYIRAKFPGVTIPYLPEFIQALVSPKDLDSDS